MRLQPDDLPALLLRGRARERQSNIEAVDDYRRALELDPADDGARLRLAGALFTFGRADEAVAHYEMLQRRRLDVFVTGGGSFDKTDAEYRADPAHPPRIQGRPCKLYRNLGAWKFQDVTAATGLDRIPFYSSHGGRPRITTATAGPTCW